MALDLIVLAETKLQEKNSTKQIEERLSNWSIIGRYDSKDNRKHMGLILLKSKTSRLIGQISVSYQIANRDEEVQIEGLVV